MNICDLPLELKELTITVTQLHVQLIDVFFSKFKYNVRKYSLAYYDIFTNLFLDNYKLIELYLCNTIYRLSIKNNLCFFAARNGNLHCLKLAHHNNYMWDTYTCSIAAATGNLNCLKYLHQKLTTQ